MRLALTLGAALLLAGCSASDQPIDTTKLAKPDPALMVTPVAYKDAPPCFSKVAKSHAEQKAIVQCRTKWLAENKLAYGEVVQQTIGLQDYAGLITR